MPPDTWQVHPGFELLGQYVDPAYVAPLTSIYESEGWKDVVPQALIDLMTKDGEITRLPSACTAATASGTTRSC